LILYLFVLLTLGLGSYLGDKIMKGSVVDQPLNPIPLQVITAIGSLAWLGWLVRGFWINWWIPLVGLAGSGAIAGIGVALCARSHKAPLISMMISLFGIGAMISAIVP
jgi:hypothetical protein